jgi:hypothetical protein
VRGANEGIKAHRQWDSGRLQRRQTVRDMGRHYSESGLPKKIQKNEKNAARLAHFKKSMHNLVPLLLNTKRNASR